MAFSTGASTTTVKTASASSSSTTGGRGGGGSMQAGREGGAKVRECIHALQGIVGPVSSLDILLEFKTPAKGLLEDEHVACAVVGHLTNPSAGHGHDTMCQWLYDTFQTGDPDLQAVVLRYVPVLCGLYLPRITSRHHESLAGFEAVLLALYAAETKARNGCPVVVNIPDLSLPSLYHSPRIPPASAPELRKGQLSAPLEPQDTVKATKRACIVGVALDLFCRKIAVMPCKAKIEACQCAHRLVRLSSSHEEILADKPDKKGLRTERSGDSNRQSGTASPSLHMPEIEIVGPGELFLGNKSPSHQNSSQNHNHQTMDANAGFSPKHASFLKHESSDTALDTKHMQVLEPAGASLDFASILEQAGNGMRIPLSMELVQPLVQILGHCLLVPLNSSDEVKGAASVAIKALHRRAFHDLMPEAMLATGSLMRLETASKAMSKTHSASENSTSSSTKPRKPEILLVSK